MTRPTIELDYTVLDCPEPVALARFYESILGWDITRDDEDWAILRGPGSVQIAFQHAPDFTPLNWPSEGIRIHLDFVVDDMKAAGEFVVAAGAELIDDAQSTFWVYRDPVGHLFCLCIRT